MATKIQATCLDPYFTSFEESLAPTNMQRRALSHYRFQLRRFGRVLEAENVAPTSLTLELADYLARQVPFHRKNAIKIPNLVRRFVLHLIDIGVAIPPHVSDAQIAKDQLLDDLERFLLGQRGLSSSSVYHIRRYAVRFLDYRFGDMMPDTSLIKHHDIVGFLEHVQKGKSLSMARTPASHLRCFFQYLFARGLTATNLSSAVPTVHRTRQPRLPRYLPPVDIEAILEWVRRESSSGQRDHAMFLLMARLGLRVPEVIAIEIDDIDWRAGELLVRGKGKQRDRLPLPEDVGSAISAYLRDTRPTTTTRVLFVRSYAPNLGFKDSRIINKLLGRACIALKIEMPARYLGSHVLRHSLATRMVRSGVALNEVGDVLRHKSRATTMIYAKLDIANLRSVAQPWPMEEILK
ncbi:MAG: site-specific integrase [Proteobacteria bacterium]|nr:site-specific integrase [Pseudomonadota bacterium]